MATDQRGNIGRTLLWALRVVSAALLAAMAVIHLLLWVDGFSEVPLIGPAFLANAVGGFLLAVAVLVASTRILPVTAALAALFTLGTLGALVVSMTVGLFGVMEQLSNPYVVEALIVEAAGMIVLALTALLAARRIA